MHSTNLSSSNIKKLNININHHKDLNIKRIEYNSGNIITNNQYKQSKKEEI